MTMSPPNAAAPVMSERRVGLIGAALAALGPFSMSLYTPAMPEIVQAFGTTEAAVKMSLSLYFAGFAFAQLVCGPLSDGLGRRPVTVGFMVVYTAASVLALVSPSIEVLIAARLLQGIGAAVGVAMSRAIVRDLFAHEQSVRIMNLIGIILVAGPAIAPTVGGLTMAVAGWHAIFAIMAVAGLAIAAMAVLAMRETVVRDLSRIRPVALLRSYGRLGTSRYFVTASLTNAGAAGAIYAQATMLPFILMDRVGLTPPQFGAAMLFQSMGYLFGSLAVRRLMVRAGAFRLVPVGLTLMAAASVALAVLLRMSEPTLLTVMLPVAVYTFGIAFITPPMTTAALAPFPRQAGAASALAGFLQMGTGMAGGAAAALMGDPVVAMATIIPLLGVMSIGSWLVWRTLPEPVVEMALTPRPAQ
jgi:DHA1 family bicyclomycin/chloramphenicol resistance-like MFS transporter